MFCLLNYQYGSILIDMLAFGHAVFPLTNCNAITLKLKLKLQLN
jgi:hypothetical protein